MNYVDTIQMSESQIKQWEEQYCRKRKVSFWGQHYFVTPILIPVIFGDGKQMISLRPGANRPDRYVIAGDSAWGLDNSDQDAFCDHLEEVYQEIENLFGNSDDDKWEDETKKQHEKRISWPALNDSCGMAWS